MQISGICSKLVKTGHDSLPNLADRGFCFQYVSTSICACSAGRLVNAGSEEECSREGADERPGGALPFLRQQVQGVFE